MKLFHKPLKHVAQQAEQLYADEKPARYSRQQVAGLIRCGEAVDGTMGGLLIGRSHNERGILVLRQSGNGYDVTCEVEGLEFILNRSAAEQHHKRLEILNNVADMQKVKIEGAIPEEIITIDCTIPSGIYTLLDAKFLVLDGEGPYYIINKHSTWKHLELLDQINKGGFADMRMQRGK